MMSLPPIVFRRSVVACFYNRNLDSALVVDYQNQGYWISFSDAIKLGFEIPQMHRIIICEKRKVP